MRREVTNNEQAILDNAKANGFMNCVDIMKALFPDRRTQWHGAYHWISGGGQKTVYLIPSNGMTGVRKSQRTGIWGTEFPPVKEYKEAWFATAKMNRLESQL